GIRDFHVTGVQTCALPICGDRPGPAAAQEWRIEAAPPGERRELLAARVRDALAGVLGTGGDIDPRARFATLGLDSVSSIELRNRSEERRVGKERRHRRSA